MKVRFRHFTRDLVHRSLDADLALAVRPKQAQRNPRVGSHLRSFGRIVVRIEEELFLFNSLQKNDAAGDVATGTARRQRHRIGFEPVGNGLQSFFEPGLELNQRVRFRVVFMKPSQGVVLSHLAHGGWDKIAHSCLRPEIRGFWGTREAAKSRLARRLPIYSAVFTGDCLFGNHPRLRPFGNHMQNVQAGNLLVSSTLVDGTVLNQAVCLMVHEDSEHAIGLMLNRPMQAMAGAITIQGNPQETPKIPRWNAEDLDETSEANGSIDQSSDSTDPPISGVPSVVISGDQKDQLAQQLLSGKLANGSSLHFGGPLSGPIVAVHSNRELAEAETGEGIFVAAQRENLEALMKSSDLPYRLIIGHLGWTAEQLENEIEEGIWHRIPATSDLLKSDDAMMWPRMIRRATANSVARWLDTTDVPGSAELN